MIKVNYSNSIITITGHAGYAEAGKDIVCASVSSIVYTTVNGILNIDKSAISFQDEADKMVIKLLSNDETTCKLIDNMLDLLYEVQRQYPNKIKISKGE